MFSFTWNGIQHLHVFVYFNATVMLRKNTVNKNEVGLKITQIDKERELTWKQWSSFVFNRWTMHFFFCQPNVARPVSCSLIIPGFFNAMLKLSTTSGLQSEGTWGPGWPDLLFTAAFGCKPQPSLGSISKSALLMNRGIWGRELLIL